MESVGVEGNGYRVNRSRYCSQRDRRKTVRSGGGGTPPSLGSSRRRPRSIINDRRRERRRGRNGGCIVRHGGFDVREVRSGRWRGEAFIRSEGGLGMFQIPLRDPRVFFGRVSLPSDQEGTGRRSSAVAYDLFNFVFFFSINQVRRWRREVLSVDFVFTIRR